MTEFNLRLKELRRRRNMSQEELANQLGISRQAIIAIEQGASLPSLPVIMAILRVLDIPFPDLFHSHWTPFRSSFDSSSQTADHRLALYKEQKTTSIPITLTENQTTLFLTAELAGVLEEDVMVDMSPQHILITAIKKPSPDYTGETAHCHEIEYGPLLRIISLPFPIDTNTASAQLKRGLLHLTLPKLMPESKRRIRFGEQNETIKEKRNGSE